MEDPKRIHFVGVGGVGMGSLAVALSRNGFTVSGSDHNLYEPMKSVLVAGDVSLTDGFLPETPRHNPADVVIIGNVVSRDNPEVIAWLKSGIPFLSFPEAVRRFLIGDKRSIVIAGTHGKTTTTSWTSFLLEKADLNPSYLIGGVPKDLSSACVIGSGALFVGEGDEYDSAFFDKGPKFLHYNPEMLVLTSIEFDHADIYRDLDHVKASFEKLVSLLPGDGLCVAMFGDETVMEVARQSLCPVQTFGLVSGAMWRVGDIQENENGFDFEVSYKNKKLGNFHTALYGEHNLLNCLAGIVISSNLGVPIERTREILPAFQGVRRRQEVLLKDPVLLIDDFAHHPTEVMATLNAVRRRHPSGRVWALFEPRSATARRSVHQQNYVRSFDSADQIVVSLPFRGTEIQENQRFSSDELVTSLRNNGKQAISLAHAEEIVAYVTTHYTCGDIIVVMSNGEFGKIQDKILRALT